VLGDGDAAVCHRSESNLGQLRQGKEPPYIGGSLIPVS